MASTLTPVPGWPQLDFSRNCTAYGQWLSAFISPNPWNRADALGGSIPLSIELFISAVPDGWVFTSNVSGTPTNWTLDASTPASSQFFGDILQWFTTHLYSTYNATDNQWYADAAFVDSVVWNPAARCPNEFCKAIAFTGNADLSGIGVIVSYYIEASLTTLYLVIFSAWRAKKWRRRRRPDPLTSPAAHRQPPGIVRRALLRVFDALRGSLDSLHVTATLFAFAILVAAVFMAAKHTREHRRHHVDYQNIPSGSSLYDSALGLLVGLYSVFPVVTLYALLPQEDEVMPAHSSSRHRGGRTDMRRGVLVILWALAITLVYIDPASELDYEFQGYSTPGDADDGNDYADVLYACDQRGGRVYWRVLWALKYLVVGVPLLWAIVTGAIYLWTLRTKNKNKTKNKSKIALSTPSKRPAARNAWRHCVAWINCAVMWTILGCLTSLRQDIIDVADGLDTENSWAFGQILSIASWGPVGVDFAFLLLFGIEDGLGGRLPLDFAIRHIDHDEHSPPPPGSLPPSASTNGADGSSGQEARAARPSTSSTQTRNGDVRQSSDTSGRPSSSVLPGMPSDEMAKSGESRRDGDNAWHHQR